MGDSGLQIQDRLRWIYIILILHLVTMAAGFVHVGGGIASESTPVATLILYGVPVLLVFIEVVNVIVTATE